MQKGSCRESCAVIMRIEPIGLLKHRAAIICLLATTFIVIKFLRVDETLTEAYEASIGLRRYKKVPTILVWHPRGLSKQVGSSIEGQLEEKCGGCFITHDRAALRRSEVIVLHENFRSGSLRNGTRTGDPDIPPIRYPQQIYVFFTKENPSHAEHWFKLSSGLNTYDGLFNMTMTYRRESDVVVPYQCWPGILQGLEDLHVPTKRKVAVMLASESWRASAKLRQIYSDELVKAGLPLERYGKSFGRRYEGKATELTSKFKFFMAFENSLNCRDYVTEKFWINSLRFGVVPVVWGTSKEDVEQVAPPNSFIHATDFESPRHLTEYLLYLDRNHTAYMEYLKWRDTGPHEPGPTCGVGRSKLVNGGDIGKNFCSMCKKVIAGFKGTVNISQWWYGTENKECLSNDMDFLSKYHSDKYGVPMKTN